MTFFIFSKIKFQEKKICFAPNFNKMKDKKKMMTKKKKKVRK